MVAGTASDPGAADHGKQVAYCSGAQVFQVHVDGCQRRVGFLGKNGPVVVTGDGDIVGDFPARRYCHLQDGSGDLIGTAGDGVNVRELGEDLPGCLPPPALGPQAVLHISYELQALHPQRMHNTADALLDGRR